ncbi:BQ5605_C023g09681 [Microbotryum silenes-dioicae]|uniref:BQ5605_C023g09681 protein n=1 Tax=Microbotryum silenes-dioicae TaxID=796604 RepID=A0A2X0MQ21_9BASI|nr:BQ5605_C023g09681 [Microbotryum silenes-dioicae]
MESPLPRRTSAIVGSSSSAGSNPPSACTPPSASRHLKRLSLSTSTSSVSSQTSLDSPTLARTSNSSRVYTSHSPHTPHRSTQHASGPTRSSLSSHPSESDEDFEEDRDSTALASVSTASDSSSKPAWNFPSPIPASSTSAPSSAHAPRVTTMGGSAAHHRPGPRSRRGSSISYSSSSSLLSLDPQLFNGASLTQAVGASKDNLGLGLGLELGSGTIGVAENDDGSDATSSGWTSPRQSRRNSSLSTSVSFLSPTRSASGMTGSSRPTLTEQNADLLSFIAKKERKCLDLREELKRHEAELKSLKSKWESIVAKSLHSPTASPTSAFPSRSPNLADPGMPRGSSHSFDIHLFASTFDPTGDEAQGSVQSANLSSISSPDVGESVQAAKAWVGGVFGRVMSTVDETLLNVVGAHPPSSSSSSSISSMASTSSESGGLRVLKEEDEDDSLASTIMSTSTKELVIEELQRSSTASTSIPTPVEQGDVPTSASKGRPRTTLDVLSSGWGNMSKRLSTVNIGDTIRSSQKAASGFVDSFENSIVSALGPLDLPPPHPSLSIPATEDDENVAVVKGYRRPSRSTKDHPRALRESSRANVVESIGVVEEVDEERDEGGSAPAEKGRR